MNDNEIAVFGSNRMSTAHLFDLVWNGDIRSQASATAHETSLRRFIISPKGLVVGDGSVTCRGS